MISNELLTKISEAFQVGDKIRETAEPRGFFCRYGTSSWSSDYIEFDISVFVDNPQYMGEEDDVHKRFISVFYKSTYLFPDTDLDTILNNGITAIKNFNKENNGNKEN